MSKKKTKETLALIIKIKTPYRNWYQILSISVDSPETKDVTD